VGICVVDLATKSILKKKGFFVRPEHSKVTKFCTELTGITSQDVRRADKYPTVIDRLKEEYKVDKIPWVSWGDYDREQFEKMSELHEVKYPFFKTHTNLKYIFAILKGMSEEVGLKPALRYLNMDFEGRPHNGADDAYNIAKIFVQVLY